MKPLFRFSGQLRATSAVRFGRGLTYPSSQSPFPNILFLLLPDMSLVDR